MKPTSPLQPALVREVFDRVSPGTVGLEEEVLLTALGGGLAPINCEVVARADDPRVKVELPTAQVELATTPHPDVASVVADLVDARRRLLQACGPDVRPVAAAVHPTWCGDIEITPAPHYRALESTYRSVARRQLVAALQVHVAVGGAERTRHVHNVLRGSLPLLAALAAAAPFHEGRDSELASVRPLLSTRLPRQGVPPVIESWEAHLDELSWGVRGPVDDVGCWWWELRPHLEHGTLEVRVPDVQPTVAEAGAVAALVRAVVLALAADHDEGRSEPVAPTWRIEENRWAALRDGVEGDQWDLVTGERSSTRRSLHRLIDRVEGWADTDLDGARRLVERNTAMALRDVGAHRAVDWLAEAFPPP